MKLVRRSLRCGSISLADRLLFAAGADIKF